LPEIDEGVGMFFEFLDSGTDEFIMVVSKEFRCAYPVLFVFATVLSGGF